MEKAFNLFVYSNNNVISELGYVVHYISSSDEETLKALTISVENDYKVAKIFPLLEKTSYDTYFSTVRLGTNLKWFEQIFQIESASQNPLVCITDIVNGQPKIDLSMNMDPFRIDGGHKVKGNSRLNKESMDDYLTKYISDAGFDIPRLIHDDYFLAIKLLRNNSHLISTMKLLLSCIDTLAFIEFGDVTGNFQKWLNTYANLSSHGVDDAELWELRNSLLHMSNLSSRKNLAKKHPSIIVYAGQIDEHERIKFDNEQNYKYLNLDKFLETIFKAIANWCNSYVSDPKKLEVFVTRYDLIVSDSRLSVLKL